MTHAYDEILLERASDSLGRMLDFAVHSLRQDAPAMMELFISFTTEHTMWIYMVVAIAQGFINIGAQLVFADVFYMNLPKVDTDLYSTFWSFSVNICVLLGQMIGTGILSLVEKPDGTPYMWMGLPFYGSQILTMVKFVFFMGMTFYIWKVCPYIKPDAEKST